MTKLFYLVSLFCFCSFSVNAQSVSESAPSVATAVEVSEENADQQTTKEQPAEVKVDPAVVEFMDKVKKNNNKAFSYTLNVNYKKTKKAIKMFKKGQKFRMEFFPYEGSLQEFTKVIVFSDGKEFHTYFPKINIMTNSKANFEITYPDNEKLAGYVLAEKTKINGLDCQMMRNEEKKAEFCINEDFGLPLYSKDNSNSSTILDVKEENLDDSFFAPPIEATVFEN